MDYKNLDKKFMSGEEKNKMLGEAYKVAYKLADRIYKKFPGLIKSVVLFGSISKAVPKPGSDIDIMIVVDDTVVMPTHSFISWYNSEIAVMIRETDTRLHVNTVTLSTFWENVKAGEPVAINVLRYGVGLIDTGFFEPLRMLLKAGRIRPTDEAIYNALTRVPAHRIRAVGRVLGAVTDLYWMAIDSAHAALMKYGKVPPSPEYVEEMLNEAFVVKKMLSKKYVDYYRELWKTSKGVVHGDITDISSFDLDRLKNMADDFSEAMKKIVESKK